MILQVMAAFDIKARCFLLPFYASHIDVGTRAFSEAANSPEHRVSKHPEDYQLYHLGTFNDDNGAFLLANAPIFIAAASQFIKGANDVQAKVS